MESILNGNIDDLKKYRDELIAYTDSKNKNDQETIRLKQLEKEINGLRKDMNEEIEGTVKKRRNEISSKYDKEISASESKLKQAKNQRDKAKEKGVKGRIADETQELTVQTNELKYSIKTEIKAKGLPRFCGSKLYHMLFFTKGPLEIFFCGLVFIVLFLFLPALVYLALPFGRFDDFCIPAFAITYFVFFVLFFFLYKVISDKTKHKEKDFLKTIRQRIDKIAENKKQIKAITQSIRSDQNEEMYGLGDYDSKISVVEEELGKISSAKEEALREFDGATAVTITDEIKGRLLPKIEELEGQFAEGDAANSELSGQVKEEGLRIANTYEAFLGKEFLDVSNVGKLIEILDTGKATTVSEAVEVYKTQP